EVGIRDFRAIQPGSGEVRPKDLAELPDTFLRLDLSKIRFTELGVCAANLSKDRPPRLQLPSPRLFECNVRQVGLAEVRPMEPCLAQIGPGQVSLHKYGLR